ncbi:MAG: hypothetical protein H6600_02320 [Flavobacteriales bacterium]|nr:hypothetical protein [Flavobacteriales bacterium]MCB9197266.1 hypothetical protein [Flavobacteriales bacterium]
MNAEEEIKRSRDKVNILRVGGLIVRGGITFMEVAVLIVKDEYLQQRASHVLIHALEYHKYKPSEEEISYLIDLLFVEGMIEGAYRNLLRTLDCLNQYPESHEGKLLDYCLLGIQNVSRPPAIRAFSIPLAYRIAVKYPDILRELREVLEGIPVEDSVSIQSRKKKYLKFINKRLTD